jgi:chemotaxis signal transduction protein
MADQQPAQRDHAATGVPGEIWCYLVALDGQVYALPDDDRTVLLPFISAVPPITSLPRALVPAYVLGLMNVAQRGEVVVDLARLLDLRTTPPPVNNTDSRRVIVVGEAWPPSSGAYRFAFVVDQGFELAQVSPNQQDPPAMHAYERAMVATPRGSAVLLDMEAVCNTILRDLGANRAWNEPTPSPEGVSP